ncbi:ADP-ribosylation factor-like protein 10 isoform X1 [Elgaria multicarinata webbii]|uniref:ADP-ribosylation factor-like protein 10 isoform X1 n=1 Tax=Elgaria multicarinata webbii TaxID=159646 RepID=UPI002FCD2512
MAPAGAFRHLSLALGAAVAALGSLLFIAWKIYFRDVNDSCIGWRRRWEQLLEAELSRNAPKGGQSLSCEYQVLVLGLDGAGKSSILHYVCSTEVKKCIAPTQGFNSVQLQDSGLQMALLEVGGSQNLRFYWNQYLSKAHILVFVVDSADGLRLHTARQELHCLLAEDPQLPLIVLANKQCYLCWTGHCKQCSPPEEPADQTPCPDLKVFPSNSRTFKPSGPSFRIFVFPAETSDTFSALSRSCRLSILK